ncbi:MAG: alpha/beta hydrolase [Candidatus Humimicrobiaceae bacterium]
MELVELLKKQLETSGIINYKVNNDMLIDFIFERVNFLTEKRKKEITIENWKAKRSELLDQLSYCIGLKNLPERAPLNAKEVGKIEKDGYFIEKIILESFKNIYISAHLYIPKKANFPVPAILHIPGHWMENGKMEPDFQRCCEGLAKLGFVVFNMDPLEQGERRIGWKNHGHLETLLVGITQIGMMIYENMKAIDYLQSREEVDGERIGMTGTSGGGFNTVYTSPFDERIKASAPICYTVTYPGIFEGIKWSNWNGGNDLCNQIPYVIDTLTFSHLLALNTPRPLMTVNAEEDLNFPLSTAIEVYKEAKPFFDLYGPGLISQVIVPGGHGEGKNAREALYGFFSKYLMGIGDGKPIPEPKIEIEEVPYNINYIDASADKDKSQSFYPKKNLRTYVFDNDKLKEIEKPLKNILIQKSKEKYVKFKLPKDLEEWNIKQIEYREKLKNMMVKTIDHGPLNPKIVSGIETKGYYIERVMLDSENGIFIPGLLFLPDNWMNPNNVWICLDDCGKIGLINNPIFSELINAKQAVFTIDLRGQGETLAVEFEAATMCYMIDRNLLSQRIFDLLRTVEYISLRASTGIQLNKQKIICYGKGMSALVALFAGAIDDRIAAIFTENQIISYTDLIAGDSRFSPSIFIYDILSNFDIDDIVSIVFPKPLIILNPVDRNKKEISSNELLKKFNFTKGIYKSFNQSNMLHIKHSKAYPYSKTIKKMIGML